MIAAVTPLWQKARAYSRKWRPQFSLRSLMVWVTIIAIFAGLLQNLVFSDGNAAAPAIAMGVALIAGRLLLGVKSVQSRWQKMSRGEIVAFAVGYVFAFLIVLVVLSTFA